MKAVPWGCDIHILEIAPGTSSEPEKHMYEEIVYVYSGRGATSVWIDEGKKQTFEWQTGSLFPIPLNAHFQHFNGSGNDPVRLMSFTTAPHMLRVLHWNEEYFYNCPIEFRERFGADDYFSAEGEMWRRRNTHVWESNFVPDARSMTLYDWDQRGAGGRNIMLMMGEGSQRAHISGFPVGTYKKGHRHSSGAHLFILGGQGFSLIWQEGEERIKCDWQAGSLFMSGAGGGAWFHQHFNSGPEPVRYLAMGQRTDGSFKFGSTEPTALNFADVSINEGGIQVEYEDEDPEIHRIFEAELASHGAACEMKGQSPFCTS